jgi:methionine-rich copper-binding protein CopC
MLRTLRRAALPALIASLAVATGAWAFHASLVKAAPAIDGTITAPPPTLTLWFNERPDVALSNIRLRGPDSVLVATSAPHAAADTMALLAEVRGTLAPGVYTVQYRTAGPDGHVMRGSYKFTLQP